MPDSTLRPEHMAAAIITITGKKLLIDIGLGREIPKGVPFGAMP
jgi:hypothetical protein